MKNRSELNDFLADEESQAFRVARYSLANEDDALDVLQDAMLKFVDKYSAKPAEEWRPLFYTILYSRLTDFHRRIKFRQGLMRLFSNVSVSQLRDVNNAVAADLSPEMHLQLDHSIEVLHQAISELPLRQQQAVLMRAWQGFDTRQTAAIMQLSEGSVKTHYARGLEKLRIVLGEQWP